MRRNNNEVAIVWLQYDDRMAIDYYEKYKPNYLEIVRFIFNTGKKILLLH